MADRLRYAAIWFLDWIVDVRILRHSCRRYCYWLASHPWWDAGDRIEARRKGKRRP